MSEKYVLVGKGNKATFIDKKNVEQEVLSRLAKGEKVRVFKGTELEVAFTLSPGAEGGSGPKPKRKASRRRTRKASAAKKGKKAKKKKTKKTKKAPKTKKKAGGKKRGPGRPKVNSGPCVVDGCTNEQRTKGLCSAHYQAHRRALKAGKPGLL